MRRREARGAGRAQALTSAPASKPRPIQQLALTLSRTVGNREAARLLQRYATTTNYDVRGPGTLVEQQWIDHEGLFNAPRYKQTEITVGATGALTAQTKSHAPSPPNAGIGAWVADPGGPTPQGKPQMHVSNNGRAAVPADGHPRAFFISRSLFAVANTALGAEGTKVRLFWTGGPYISVNGLRLHQASVEEITNTGPAGHVATHLRAECSDLAQHVVGYNVLEDRVPLASFGAQTNAATAPTPGRVYGFQSGSAAPDGFADVMPTKKKALRSELKRIVGAWIHAEQDVAAGIDVAGTDPKATGLLAGWGNHFETVVAVDGPDTVTLANYNRSLGPGEVLAQKRLLFRALFLRDDWFQDVFIAKCLADAKAQKKLGRPFDWGRVFFAMDTAIQQARTDGSPEVRDAIGRFDAFQLTATQQSDQMWYFDMYQVGDAAKSFHGRYRWAGRGNSTMTRVHPRPAPAPAPAAPAGPVPAGPGGG